jgi:hypothetical protein
MNTASVIETLAILTTATFDGDLPSKVIRDHLVDRGLVDRGSGYNWLNEKGVELCKTLLILRQ